MVASVMETIGRVMEMKYTIDVNAAGTAGTSDWSGAISLTAD